MPGTARFGADVTTPRPTAESLRSALRNQSNDRKGTIEGHGMGRSKTCGHRPRWAVVGLLMLACGPFAWIDRAGAQEEVRSLDTNWEVSLDQGNSWLPIVVPGTVEDQVDVGFDGVSWYRHSLVPPNGIMPGQRVILRFQAVATHATVLLNGHKLGEHLGGWTPFEFDITDRVRWADGPMELVVHCDERVGHNTQGFLPIVAPHFSGIWKPVQLVVSQDRVGWEWAHVDESSLVVSGTGERRLTIQGQIVGWTAEDQSQLVVEGLGENARTWRLRPESLDALDGLQETDVREPSQTDPSPAMVATVAADGRFEASCLVPEVAIWTPSDPRYYELQITLQGSRDGNRFRHRIARRVGFRSVDIEGDRLRLNGRTIQVRGLLNWGLPPTRFANPQLPPQGFWWEVAPTLDERVMRRELEMARSMGFNLMKFCLWIPPKRYLELCDEMGMLAWIEYPTWHPDFSAERLAELQREFDEFFAYVGDHPCVILHSLTCETGPGADIEVIRALYNQCKRRIPGAVVEDDSSWIQWNRVHDFYDDHPYGNNHTWVATLQRLKDYIAAREVKPLVLGEAIAADTWVDPLLLATPEQLTRGTPLQWPAPDFLQGNFEWLNRMRSLFGLPMVDHLTADSLHYAWLMRKYQIETYRREVPAGGYVVSVIRDFRKAAMGLVDFRDKMKWPAEQWSWHGDATIILKTEGDARSFVSQQSLAFDFLLSRYSNADFRAEGNLVVKLIGPAPSNENGVTEVVQQSETPVSDIGDGLVRLGNVHWKCPAVAAPTRFVVQADLVLQGRTLSNAWPIWVVPEVDEVREYLIYVDSGLEPEQVGLTPEQVAGDLQHLQADFENGNDGHRRDRVLLTYRLSQPVLECLEHSHVVLIPNNQASSFPTAEHWFLRGGPIPSRGRCYDDDAIPHSMLVELQHFDLAGPVVPDLQYLDQIEPVLLLWDNHDRDHVQTHGVAFELGSPAGGRLLVTAANHRSAAGAWVLDRWIRNLIRRDDKDRQRSQRKRADEGFWNDLVAEITDQKIELAQREWRFRPEHQKEAQPRGVDQGWHEAEFPDAQWDTIRIDRHWEGQGDDQPWKALDGWAWYRIEVEVPADWHDEPTFLNFTGVDDYFRVFVNGVEVGSGGDIETRTTAFDARISFDISEHVRPGGKLVIAVAVYDWYGAGGIFRPVSLTHRRLDTRPRILK